MHRRAALAAATGLRLMCVHAHPDDESSKGAATMARYAEEGVDVLVVTLTDGSRGSVLNPAMDRPEVAANITAVRAAEMERAREILGVRQVFLGYVDSGLPEGDPLPPLPEGCFALGDLEEQTRALVEVVRRERPHVMTTYDETGGYPHPDHIRCHEVSVAAFEAAGDPDRFPDAGEPWQPLKLYYNHTFHKDRLVALHTAMTRARDRVAVRRVARRLGRQAGGRRTAHHVGALRRALRHPRRRAHRARDPGRPERPLVRLPARPAAAGVADRGLPARPVARRHRPARGRPVRRRARAGRHMTCCSRRTPAARPGRSASPWSCCSASPSSLLIRNMDRRIKRLPREFPADGHGRPRRGTAPDDPGAPQG